MKRKHPLLYRILSVVLSFAVVLPATVALVGDSGSARAVTSLPYVEKLKASGGTFNILEIVPGDDQGSIGYYIDGQEPCANWAKAASKQVGKDTRKSYVDNLFTSLISAGLLGSENTTPLKKTILSDGSLYNEVYPWEGHDGYSKMDLDHSEQTTVQGFFSFTSNGAFVQSDNEFVYASGGSYVQVIDYFANTAVNPKGSDRYYYAPVFSKIENLSSVPSGTAVYYNSTNYEDSSAAPANDGYVYEGTVGASDFPGMEIGRTYYYVSSYGAPSETQDGINMYVAASSAYRQKTSSETGYFSPKDNVITYRYVGTGGTYNFEVNDNGYTANIDYSIVYYKGGFTNNNWFLRYVLDWSPENAEIKPNIIFKVNSVTPSKATAADVEAASLVVLSKGFIPGNSGAVSSYGSTNDISSAVSSAIMDAVEQASSSDTNCNLPVIVDNRLTSSAPNLSALVTNIKGGSQNNSFINKSVFFFAPDTTRTDLATANFKVFYPSASYITSGSAFYPAYEEIVNENFLRTTENSNAVTLEEKVNLARAIRYIINFAGKRVITPKTRVSVLEIEPGSGSQLTADIVRGWLGNSNVTVSIDTMSTAELVGKIDVINEKYDIVYIGSKVAGFNPTNLNTTDFNDGNLDGMVYSNIGDTAVMQSSGSSGYTMSGLLDRDYSTMKSSDGTYNRLNTSTNLTKTFRYSGNDLTATKTQELLDFINSGFPMIIADDLTTGGRHAQTDPLEIRAVVTLRDSDKTLVATPTEVSGNDIPSFITPTYKWYSTSSSTTVIGTSQTYKPTAIGTYYCIISYTLTTGTYIATSNTVTVTPKTVYSYATSGSSTGGTYVTSIKSYTLTLKPEGRPYYSVSVTPDTPADNYSSISYQWQGSYYDTDDNDYWHDVGNDKADFKDNTPYYYFRCIVTIDGRDFTTGKMYYTNTTNVTSTATVETIANFNVSIRPDIGENNVTLSASAAPNTGAALQWYVKGNGNNYSTYSTAASITVTSGVYYCTGTGKTNAKSITYTISSSQTGFGYAVNTGGTTTGVIASQPATGFLVNTATVDNSSYIYTLLDAGKLKLNVMQLSTLAAAENKDKLNKYVNLSKPVIVYSPASDIGTDKEPYPTVYSNNNGTITSLTAKSDSSYALEYYFSIKNDTDTDPANTRYTCYLYVDANGDGRYSTGERLSDVIVRIWDSNTKTAGSLVTATALKADSEYYVSRSMPSDKHGIIPWKLEIIKTATSGVVSHTSDQNYTHIPTAAGKQISLDILQINASDGNGLSLASQMQTASASSFYSNVTHTYYRGIYGKLFADISNDYNVTITTVLAGNINPTGSSSQTWTHGSKTYGSFLDYLKSYDMIITGFEDCYGELNQLAAQAITAYIGTGKAILFTHDNTSFYNLPSKSGGYQTNNNSTVSSGWGYSFNTTIRDAVGLDRYGVTDTKYGISSYAPTDLLGVRTSDWSGLVSKSYSGATTANLNDLIGAGYSVAYQPGKGRANTVGETQGFTRGILDRYKGSSDNNKTTKSVSQVNQGQITTYPYNVNTNGYASNNDATNTMAVAETHFQYYQLNMNSADTVVWYCLNYKNTDSYGNYISNNDSVNLFNDAINSYYIYSKGNVTYSGAGHTTDTSIVNSNMAEAQLFVNTMIAAYRIAQIPPRVQFSDSTGKNTLKYFLMPADDSGVLALPDSSDTSRYIYFTVNDSSIGANKTISVRFSYGDSNAQATVPVYKSETNSTLATGESVISGLTYYIKIDDLWNALPANVKSTISDGIRINITAYTSIGGNSPLSTTASMSLRTLTLFNLS